MLITLQRKLVAGDSATVYLSLARFGAVEVRARVVKYTELLKSLE